LKLGRVLRTGETETGRDDLADEIVSPASAFGVEIDLLLILPIGSRVWLESRPNEAKIWLDKDSPVCAESYIVFTSVIY
jgi:hypothetical protein